jgi:hypothetical protein
MDGKSFAKAKVYAQKRSEVLAGINAPPEEQAEAALQWSEALLGQGDAAGAARQAQRAFVLARDEPQLAPRIQEQLAAVSQAIGPDINEAIRQAASAPAGRATAAGVTSSPGR